ncbi:hypothetical protein JR316_0001725 [Psilocybe cubensis]|uniref:Uncharacterized protein n=1 Tax=Psilocybe cubensis TaxID=181762 RepID=A0ACB8HA60_PSICU|nr:hypothetical protein JR316_0001725 [Psilocybe cubensis]KAH9484823.1 hypothetical protein JR316_0001725 [Psilocybe cubensis]
MLRRSQALPLSIKFDKSVSNEGRKEEFNNVLKVIHLHCDRWRSVELADLTFDFGILSGLEEAHPIDCLRLISVQNYRVRDTFPSPNPKYLVPTTLYMNDSSLIIPLIRLDNLTHLEVARVPTDQVRITHFTQHAALSFPVDSLPPTPIVNNTITHAKIRSGFNVSFNLLEYLALLQLKYFYYDIGPSSNHLLRPLLAFLRRSQAHLDDFAFNFTVISRNKSTQLDNRFHKLSQITRIKLKVSTRPNRRLGPLLDKFLGALDNRNSDSYFPNLRELEIIVPPMLMSPVSWSKIDFKRYDSWEVGSDQEYTEENTYVEDTESDDTSDEENLHDICGFKGGIIMDRTTYDLIVHARKSGISVDLINTDGSDILDNVARLGFGEEDNKNDPSTDHSAC